MQKLLDKALFGTVTVQDLLIAAVGFMIAAAFFGILRRVFRKTGPDHRHYQNVACASCGWQGTVSRHAGRCPKCNRDLGDRKAERQAY